MIRLFAFVVNLSKATKKKKWKEEEKQALDAGRHHITKDTAKRRMAISFRIVFHADSFFYSESIECKHIHSERSFRSLAGKQIARISATAAIDSSCLSFRFQFKIAFLSRLVASNEWFASSANKMATFCRSFAFVSSAHEWRPVSERWCRNAAHKYDAGANRIRNESPFKEPGRLAWLIGDHSSLRLHRFMIMLRTKGERRTLDAKTKNWTSLRDSW